ncbi:hypothetical protein AAHA92_00531 [Salvia divinorum]|uniref:Uncharacterized protein n=1 Tax=Salvia divinorum TaxID=28513 RepID=A0ABD1IJV4_SALDI
MEEVKRIRGSPLIVAHTETPSQSRSRRSLSPWSRSVVRVGVTARPLAVSPAAACTSPHRGTVAVRYWVARLSVVELIEVRQICGWAESWEGLQPCNGREVELQWLDNGRGFGPFELANQIRAPFEYKLD